MRPSHLPLLLVATLGGAAALVFGGALWVLVDAAAADADDFATQALVAGLGAFMLFVAVLAWSWAVLERRWVRPLAVLVRQMRTVIHAKTERGIELEPGHGLGELPATAAALARQLISSRHGVVKAMATAGARMEEQKGRLEAVLRDLDEGVLVCNLEHRVLLYNQAARRIAGARDEIGLGRSLFHLLTREPVLHALERLEARLAAESAADTADGAAAAEADISIPFVCAAADARRMLQGHLRPLPDSQGGLVGYVLTFLDVGARMLEVSARDQLLRRATEELRSPVANLMAAAETLTSHPHLAAEERAAFEGVLASECARLSVLLESLAEARRRLPVEGGSMFDLYSADLLGCVVRHLAERPELEVTMVGLPLWLHGGSHSLVLTLEHLITHVHRRTGVGTFDLEPVAGDRRVYVDVVWEGEPIPSRVLDEWLAEPLAGAPGEDTVRQVLERHGSEPWSRRRDSGQAVLRIPLPPATESRAEAPRPALPPRPVFYDFELMTRGGAAGDLESRPLAELSYVVFDTETTGLRPSEGDEILSIAGVRVVNRRILPGETFERLVHPGRSIPKTSIRFHGITEEMVAGEPPLTVVLPQFRSFVGGAILVGHNAAFDMKFIRLKEKVCGVRFDNPALDTLLLSVFLHSDAPDQTLDGIAARLGIDQVSRHTALGDALTTAAIFVHLIDLLAAQGVETLGQAREASSTMVDILRQQAQF